MVNPVQTLSDEDILRNHLSELRSQARMYRATAQKADNSDTQATMNDIADDLSSTARALHRVLDKAGIKSLGPTEGV